MYVIDKSLKTALSLSFGVVLAAFTLSACQNSQKRDASGAQPDILKPAKDVVVAKIGKTDVFYSDVRKIAVEQGLSEASTSLRGSRAADFGPMDAAVFNESLDRLINQKLLAKNAARKGLDKTPEARRRMAAARERLLSSIAIEAHIRETVTEEAMRQLYDRQAGLANLGDEIRARHILVKTEKDALELVDALEDEGDFEALAAKHSIDLDTRDRGGDLGYFTRDMLPQDFVTPIFKGKTGKAIAPYETAKGWHIAEILDRRRHKPKSYEESREALRNFLTFDAIESFTRDLRARGNVKLIPVVDAPESSDK